MGIWHTSVTWLKYDKIKMSSNVTLFLWISQQYHFVASWWHHYIIISKWGKRNMSSGFSISIFGSKILNFNIEYEIFWVWTIKIWFLKSMHSEISFQSCLNWWLLILSLFKQIQTKNNIQNDHQNFLLSVNTAENYHPTSDLLSLA